MAKWPYNTPQWQALRKQKLDSRQNCEECIGRGTITKANVVDHVLAISQGGDPFPPLDALRSLCARCHNAKTARGPEAGAVRTSKPRRGCSPDGTPLAASHPWNGGNGRWSREVIERRMPPDLGVPVIPVTMVCGPPGSGKSTYVRTHAAPDDLIICFDTIMQKLSGEPEHCHEPHFLQRAMEDRNKLLRSLSQPSIHAAAWFIICAPSPREREVWAARLRANVVLLDVPADECARRIKADPAREGHHERMIQLAVDWWQSNPHRVRKSLSAGRVGPPSPLFR